MSKPMTDKQVRGSHSDCYKEVHRLRKENIPTCRKLHPTPDDYEMSRGPMCPDCYDVLKQRVMCLREENERLKEGLDAIIDAPISDELKQLRKENERARELLDEWIEAYKVEYVVHKGTRSKPVYEKTRTFLDGDE